MVLGFLYVCLGFYSVFESCACVVVNLNQVGSLIVHLRVDILSDRVDVSHELFNIV